MKTHIYIVLLAGLLGIKTAEAQDITNAQQDNSPTPPATASTPAPPNDNTYMPLPSGYFEVGFGLAQPVGGFAKHNGIGYGGYAISGDNVNISVAAPIDQTNFGLAFSFGSFSNLFDIDSYVSNVAATDPSKSYQPLYQDQYYESVFLAGLFATFPISHLSIDFRLMGGVALCTLPEVDYGASQYDAVAAGYDTYEWDTYPSKSVALAFGAGADLRYKFRRLSLMLGVDFATANPHVNTEQQYTDPNGDYTYNSIGGNVPISILSFNLGLAFEIK